MLNKKRMALLATLACLAHTQLSNAQYIDNGVSFFSPRPQGTNIARDSAGIERYRIPKNTKNMHGFISVTPAYNQSLRPKRIAQALFGSETLTISGSQVTNRGQYDLLADYFGLSPNFISSVTFEPLIQNALAVFSGYWELDQWAPGLYFDINVPVGWTRWKMGIKEEVIEEGNTNFPPLYMAPQAVTPPISGFKQALNGSVTFGQMQDPLKFGKITCGGHTEHGVADVTMGLGWNFIKNPWGHVGAKLRTTIPTGTHVTNQFFFEPVLGNGRHVELGVGLDGHALVWEKDGCQELILYGGVNFMYLFNAHQQRSFDLKQNQHMSRYTLTKQFDAQGNYINSLSPVINHTTLPCNVRINLQTDIVVMFDYRHNQVTFDIGYNGYIRSKERICLRSCDNNSSAIPANTYGLKGIQNTTTDTLNPSPITQSTATIFGNPFADQVAVGDANSPVFFNTSDIDLDSAASPRIVTQKLFTHVGYTWHYASYCQPFAGIGGEIEFEGINPRNTAQPVRNTMSQWGVWLKGGVAFR
jgi:hypothetical protein